MEEQHGETVPVTPPPTPGQMEHLVERLDKAVREYLAIGASSSLKLSTKQLGTVLGWALREAKGEAPEVVSPATEVEYFMTGLLEEIIQVPSNTFEEVTFPDGTRRYVPLTANVWQQCLEVYSRKMAAGVVGVGQGKLRTESKKH